MEVARNRALFQERWPGVWEKLSTADAAPTRVEARDGPVTNVDLGNGRLYPDDAAPHARDQVSRYLADPDRIAFSDPGHCNLSPVSEALLADLTAWLEDGGGVDTLKPMPVVDVGYLFVFGVGLGAHLPLLLAGTPARRLVLVEPVVALLSHALEALDWCALAADADRRGVEIHWVLEESPETILRVLERILLDGGNTFIDGSLFFLHYPSWVLTQSRERLKERIKAFYLSAGFFEDEVEMVRNAHANLMARDTRIVEDRPVTAEAAPVFLVGAGPSLDRDLAHLKRLRDRAVVVSCGTALPLLLANGVRPDFHCEMERVPLVPTLLKEAQGAHGFDGITLIAAATTHPEACALFEHVWLYHRAALSPSRLFAGGALPLRNADPLVVNAAFDAVTALGFRTVYLFGCDLALVDKDRHHARDSIYFQPGREHFSAAYRDTEPRLVPGNFGGTVKTLWAYDAARRMIGVVQRRKGVALFNCGHGARIEGAVPKAATALDVGSSALDREALVARLGDRLRAAKAGEIPAGVDMAAHVKGCEAAMNALPDLARAMGEEDPDLWSVERRLKGFMTDGAGSLGGFLLLAHASMGSMVRLGAFFATRVAAPDRRRDCQRVFAESFARQCLSMVVRTRALFEDIQAGRVSYEPAAILSEEPAP